MPLFSRSKILQTTKECADEFKKLNEIAIKQIPPELYEAITEYFFATGYEFCLTGNVVPINEILDEERINDLKTNNKMDRTNCN